MSDIDICLFTKDSLYCDIAVDFLKRNFLNYEIVKKEPEHIANTSIFRKKFDYILAFLYPNLIPENILKKARKAAINFHPGPPEFPGTGCYNFALYKNNTTFGTTCHHMVKEADSGKIILVKRFPMFPTDTVGSLKNRTMVYTLLNFYELMYMILKGRELPRSREVWSCKPRTKNDLNQLLNITLDMPNSEIDRRIRATAHENYPGPFIEINGKKYNIRAVEND